MSSTQLQAKQPQNKPQEIVWMQWCKQHIKPSCYSAYMRNTLLVLPHNVTYIIFLPLENFMLEILQDFLA